MAMDFMMNEVFLFQVMDKLNGEVQLHVES
jgi:hypothetical protein